ncbi:hypothetical protein [Streptomyces sp. WAC08241]|uniref:hypothetical protein n=1 Tax=Streptomyces sp. WAC08241 TaxID=2487421 RepID=UPI000F78CA6D|nr:hypothetical protein [Streptomyces sp. WAC08241]RSS46222.1 hypothetical protein EF906_02635 [Streptomyces sp. WAC08241]
MTDYAHAIQRQHALQRALKERFGRPADWPLKIQAAYAQVELMQRLMGEDYTHFIRCAQQAIHDHRNRWPFSTLQFRHEHLKPLLQVDGRHEPSETLDLGWVLNASLEALLDGHEYERLIDAAVEAAQPAVTV